MQKGILFLSLFIICGIMAPHDARAYFVKDAAEFQLKDGSGLYLLSFTMGVKKYGIDITPRATYQGTSSPESLSFRFLDADGNEATGTARGIVLSDAPLGNNGYYKTAQNTENTYTLLVVFTPETKGVDRYRMHVTHLPFVFSDGSMQKLNPSELEYYKTGLLDL